MNKLNTDDWTLSAFGEAIKAAQLPNDSYSIALGNVDDDPDIVASNRWDNVTSYDPVAKTSIWTDDINDFCSLRLYNVDGDTQDELIAGPCHTARSKYMTDQAAPWCYRMISTIQHTTRH